MPAFSEGRHESARFYRFAWLPDGYPGRRESDGRITPHPIYGIYVLSDYLYQLSKKPGDQTLTAAVRKVATAARKRMRGFKGSAVFWYTPKDFPSTVSKAYYSGLTQSYWANMFHRVSVELGDRRFADSAYQVFKSLLISDKAGGVLERTPYGVAVAEYPTSPRYMVLNGWLSSAVSIHEYAARSGNKKARQLADATTATLAKVLPLYDVPKVRNSRYGLAGYQPMRVRFSSKPGLVRSVTFHTPTEGSYVLAPGRGPRSSMFVDRADVERRKGGFVPKGTGFGGNLYVSRIGYPKRSSLSLSLDVSRKTTVSIQVAVGTYDPMSYGPKRMRWFTVARQDIGRGRATIKAVIPWSTQHFVAHPTNFAKTLEGKRTNVYHMIHIHRLAQLFEITGDETFRRWGERWGGYVCDWTTMGVYKGLHVFSSSDVITPKKYCDSAADPGGDDPDLDPVEEDPTEEPSDQPEEPGEDEPGDDEPGEDEPAGDPSDAPDGDPGDGPGEGSGATEGGS